MSRYIDADALIEYLKKMWGKWDEDDWYEAQAKDAMKDDIEIVNKQPTVDAVQVVRCMECENWDTEYSSGRKSLGNFRCICQEWSNAEDGFYRYTAEDDYCSYGERKSE